MIRRVAFALCASLCPLLLAVTADAGLRATYTWKTLSQSNLAVDLKLSFAVDGNVSIGATSDFAPPSNPPIPYPFPPELVAFDLQVGFLSITLNDFTSEQDDSGVAPFFPEWNFSLDAAASGGGADLALFFINNLDTEEISGPGELGPGEAPGIIGYTSDGYTGCNHGGAPCTFTGILVANVPEPASFILLAVGLLGLGAARRRRAAGSMPRATVWPQVAAPAQ